MALLEPEREDIDVVMDGETPTRGNEHEAAHGKLRRINLCYMIGRVDLFF